MTTLTTTDRLAHSAHDAVTRKVREAVLNSVNTNGDLGEQLDCLESAVMKALADPSIAWAQAYLAGVRMAPEVLKRCAHAPPPNPPCPGGG